MIILHEEVQEVGLAFGEREQGRPVEENDIGTEFRQFSRTAK